MKILNNLRVNDRSPSIKGPKKFGLFATMILSVLILHSNVTAQDYFSSDATRAKKLQEETGSRGDSGTGSLAGATTRSSDKPVRRVDFFVCNFSSRENISVAYSVFADQKVRGWKNVKKGKCKLVIARQTFVKFYAFSGKATWSGKNLLWKDQPLEWSDPYALCVDLQHRFEVATDRKACPDGYTRVRFHFANVESRDEDKDGRFCLKLRD